MWHVHTGRLLATFRGHSKEICDIDINFENTLVASASLDKKVRVWNLKTTKMECVLHGHQSGINATKVCLNKLGYLNIYQRFFLVFAIL
jgi:bromodomain and WD repeat domain-containing protein 1/3